MSDAVRERWALRGNQVRAGDGSGPHVATYMRNRAEGALIAAAPRLQAALRVLLGECEMEVEEGVSHHSFAALEEARAALAASRAAMAREEKEDG